MNYFAPRQLKNGLWHYTCQNDGIVWPVGYCASCQGHITEDEARKHYREYLLEERLHFANWDNLKARCKECGEFTSGYVSVDGWYRFEVCEKHQTKEIVEKHLIVGDSMSS